MIGRLRKFFKKMFGEIRSAFGEKWTDEEIEELRLSDFAKMALKDIISGKTVEEWAARTIGGETLDRVERIRISCRLNRTVLWTEFRVSPVIFQNTNLACKKPFCLCSCITLLRNYFYLPFCILFIICSFDDV